MRRVIYLKLLTMLGISQGAVTIEWSSDFNATNLQSDGSTPLDNDFVLGTFEGITPTAGNMGEWAGAWRPFGTAAYRADFSRFSKSMTLETNAPPFTTTARAYIWGRNGLEAGSEWILIGKETWKWPVADPGGPPPFPVRWLVAQASQEEDVVVGEVTFDPVTETSNMETQGITSGGLGYDEWVVLKFDAGDSSGQSEDFDLGGRSNFLEYALDSDPKVRDGSFEVSLNSDLEIEFVIGVGRQVNWLLKASDDLTEFTTITEGFEVINDAPDLFTFKLGEPLEGKRFFKVEAVAP